MSESPSIYRTDRVRRIDSDEADPFGHRDYAAAVVSALSAVPSHFTLGLFGPWGSGKSTILAEVRRRIRGDEEVKSEFVLFDAWRYDGDSLRREFIKAVGRSLEDREAFRPDFDFEKHLEPLEVDRTTQSRAKLSINWGAFANAGLAAGIVAAITAIVVLALPKLGLSAETTLQVLIGTAGALTTFVLFALQPVVSPDPVQQTRKRLEYPDEFASSFTVLLGEVQAQRLVIAIDNLDRCSPARVTETLATIKTFLEPAFESSDGSQGRQLQQLCFIVAADDTALRRHLTSQELSVSAAGGEGDTDTSGRRELPREVRDSVEEYLRKFFSACVRIRDVLDEDIRQFTEEEFEGFFAARDEIVPPARDELIDMTSQALKRNPRRIVQFVNNLAFRLELLEERKREERIQINPELLMVAKLAILEEEWPERYEALQRNPRLLGRWHTEAGLSEASDDSAADGASAAGFENFLRFTDHVKSPHIRAYLDLKQTKDELNLPGYNDFVELLDGGDAEGLRALIAERVVEESEYVSAAKRHFDRQTRPGGSWNRAHGTLRSIIEVAELHGEKGAVAAHVLDEATSHPGLKKRLKSLEPETLLSVAEKYVEEEAFSELVEGLVMGMNDTDGSERRARISLALSMRKEKLKPATVQTIATTIQGPEIRGDFDSYVSLAEALPEVTNADLGDEALTRLEQAGQGGVSAASAPLRVAIAALVPDASEEQIRRLLEQVRISLAALAKAGEDEYGIVAKRLSSFVDGVGRSVSRRLKGDTELPHATAYHWMAELAAEIDSGWGEIPTASQDRALRLGLDICRVSPLADKQVGDALGRRVSELDRKTGSVKWVTRSFGSMPEGFRGGIVEGLAEGLSREEKESKNSWVSPLMAKLPGPAQDAVRQRSIRLAVDHEAATQAGRLLEELSSEAQEATLEEMANAVAQFPTEIESRLPKPSLSSHTNRRCRRIRSPSWPCPWRKPRMTIEGSRSPSAT